MKTGIVIDRVRDTDLVEYGLLLEDLSEKRGDPAAMRRTFDLVQTDPAYYLLAARMDGVLAGSIMAIRCLDLVADCRPFLLLENLIIRHDMRGRGVGTALLRHSEDIARSLDCLYIIGVSGMKRTGAHRLYESLGYAEDPVRGFRKFFQG